MLNGPRLFQIAIMADESDNQDALLFDERFFTRYLGSIAKDPFVAIVELVANAWDAFATKVEIDWPSKESSTPFRIQDDGEGMTAEQFMLRWRTLEYNRHEHQGGTVKPPLGSRASGERRVFGRNGKGRHAAFLFSVPYKVRTWRDGVENTFVVGQSATKPLLVELVETKQGVSGTGTEILATRVQPVNVTPEAARAHLSTRFLVDPQFDVSIDGVKITFDDVPQGAKQTIKVPVADVGTATLLILDSEKADKTTRQHGIAWRVQNRLVGNAGWHIEYETILDGRTAEAKRYTFLVFADFLSNAVLPDWSGFDGKNNEWVATNGAVKGEIQKFLAQLEEDARRDTKNAVKARVAAASATLPPLGREKLNAFIEEVVENCPSIGESDLTNLSSVLAKLEEAESQYDLLRQLDELTPGDLDTLNRILTDWTVGMAKIALDEIAKRLKLISELKAKLPDVTADEVHELQPLFERGLWIFGPQFESIEFTSNRGMSKVVRELFGKGATMSRNRPDFVVLPDASIGFYSTPSYDDEHNEAGIDSLVVVEIKRAGVAIGRDEKNQAWKYVRELYNKGFLNKASSVTAFVLGSLIEAGENHETSEMDGRVRIRPMLFDTFLIRAERRMLNLHSKLKDAPILKAQGIDDFLRENTTEYQSSLKI